MSKYTMLATLLFVLNKQGHSQDDSLVIEPPPSAFYFTLSLSSLTEFNQSSLTAGPTTPSGSVYNSLTILNLISLKGDFRWNLAAPSDEASVSLDLSASATAGPVISDTTPAFTSNNVRTGFFSLHCMPTVNFNYGYHATRYSFKETGFSAGLGAQICYGPLVSLDEDPTIEAFRKYWIQPVIHTSFKIEREKSSQVRKVDVAVGFLNGFSVRIYWGYIFGYD